MWWNNLFKKKNELPDSNEQWIKDPINKGQWRNDIPFECREKSIIEMCDKEYGWAVPWALYNTGRWLIRKNYTIGKRGGTAQLLVVKSKGIIYAILFDKEYRFQHIQESSWHREHFIPCRFSRVDQLTVEMIQEFLPDIQNYITEESL